LKHSIKEERGGVIIVNFSAKKMLLVSFLYLSVPALVSSQNVLVQSAQHSDESPSALRDVRPRFVATAGVKSQKAVRLLPLPSRNANAPMRRPNLQTNATSVLDVDSVSFEGIGKGSNYDDPVTPSDSNGAVGETQFVEWVNQAYGIFDKGTGTLQFSAEGRTLWKGFGGKCEVNNDGDPIVQYDKIAHRWLMTQFVEKGGAPFLQCIAVSKTSDAGGGYYRYSFEFTEFNDYGKFSVWPDGYYASFNMFQDEDEGPLLGGRACVFEREKMLTGAPARMICFDLRSPIQAGLLPSDFDGTTAHLPPDGAPAYFLNFGVDKLNVWAFRANWTQPNASSFESIAHVAVEPFDPACGIQRFCIPQKGTSILLQSLADRMMYRLAYRNTDSGQLFVVNHSVQGGDLTPSAIRWYVLGISDNTIRVIQQGTYAPDRAARWMGSIAMDHIGDIFLGYSVSDGASAATPGLFPSIAFSGREAGDSPGLAKETLVKLGRASQASVKWGDYSSVSVDPSDDCTFWFTSQYQSEPGIYVWRTLMTKVKFRKCH
jgi:hypothetical protein